MSGCRWGTASMLSFPYRCLMVEGGTAPLSAKLRISPITANGCGRKFPESSVTHSFMKEFECILDQLGSAELLGSPYTVCHPIDKEIGRTMDAEIRKHFRQARFGTTLPIPSMSQQSPLYLRIIYAKHLVVKNGFFTFVA